MISDEEARFKAATLKKFKEEQYQKMGGSKAPTTGVVMGALFYGISSRYISIVPYKLIISTIGYGVGVNLATYFYGDKNHNVYYTRKEYEVLKQHLGQSWVNRIKVIPEETIDGESLIKQIKQE